MIPSARSLIPAAISLLAMTCSHASAQRPAPVPVRPTSQSEPLTVSIAVRDSRGMPLESAALVRIHSAVAGFDLRSPTREGSTAVFNRVNPGEYDVEVQCTGFKTASEQIQVSGIGGDFTSYIFLQRESESSFSHQPPSGILLSPKLQAEIGKGLEAMRKHQFESAQSHFLKATRLSPTNSDAAFLLGTAELALQHDDLARSQFETALKIEPTHEHALLALGELQLRSGDNAAAIHTLEKAYLANGASWRTHLLLAIAYSRSNQWPEAEQHAERAMALAASHAAYPTYLLGEIQFAEGREADARAIWEHLLTQFPDDAIAPRAKQRLASVSDRTAHSSSWNSAPPAAGELPLAAAPSVTIPAVVERPWAPPDIDGTEYALAASAPCHLDDVLARASTRLNAQLADLEKFTATERIEHQEIDRYGVPGAVRSRDFSYIIFVHALPPSSFYLEESRNGSGDVSSFPTSLATTGLLGLGVAILQPVFRPNLSLVCEGLTSIRGQAAWQIHFQEEAGSSFSIREWRKSGALYSLPVKGRFWLSAASFDLLRIETDLIAPQPKLELTRDHLSVDYGPVSFDNSITTLWLPWSAEMFMELHRRRYHHQHFLTDYLLFSIATTHKISPPRPTNQ